MAFSKRAPKLGASKPNGLKEVQNLFKRRANAIGFDWVSVDTALLKGALTCALAGGAAVMFSAAAGGRGICIKVFMGEERAIEYAIDAEELNVLLDQVIDQMGSPAEDTRAVMAMTPNTPA